MRAPLSFMMFLALAGAWFGVSQAAYGQEVVSVTWKTEWAAKPLALTGPAAPWLPAFRIAARALPESLVISAVLAQPAAAGLRAEECAVLRPLIQERYRLIQADPVFARAPSAVAYCYAGEKPAEGLALVYRPKISHPQTPVLVFLHGYGGSFLWCQHLLAEAFPDRVIICPAYGMTSAEISPQYVLESMAAAERQLGHTLGPVSLVGLSGGGLGAARVYPQMAQRFQRLVVLAAYPPADALPRFGKGMSVSFVAGAQEDYVRSGLFQRSMDALRQRVDGVNAVVLPAADHFFLLAQREETVRLLKEWLR